MTDRLKKEEFVRLLATRMNADEATATAWLDGVVETRSMTALKLAKA